MAENTRNQDQTPGSARQNRNMEKGNQTQNTSTQTEQNQNPQRGSKWHNYQTREMSDEGYSGENLSSEGSQEA